MIYKEKIKPDTDKLEIYYKKFEDALGEEF